MPKKSLALLALLITGCGSDPGSSLGSANPLPDQVPLLIGRVNPGFPLAGASVRFESADGQVLPLSASTNASGTFVVDSRGLPPDFRIRVRAGSAGPELLREIRQLPPQGGSYTLNLVTHLVSLYWQGHPGQSLNQAELAVSQSLGIGPGRDLGSLGERSAFSHLVFYSQASNHGGVAAFAQSWTAQIGSAGADATPFKLRGAPSLQPNLSGLEPEIRQAAIRVFNEVPPVAGLGQESESYAKKLLDEVAADELHGLLQNGAGWLASALGINFLPSQELTRIQAEVDALNQEVKQLLGQTTVGFLTTEYNAIIQNLKTNATDKIDSLTNQLDLATSTVVQTAPIVNTPYATPGGAAPYLTNITNYDARFSLNLIQSSMLGLGNTPNLVSLFGQLQMSSLGFQDNGSYQNFPLRCNSWLAQWPLAAYYGYQVEGLHLLLEGQHSQIALANAINTNLSLVRSSLASLKRQSQQQSQAFEEEDLLLDLQYGKIWCLQVQDQQNYPTALAAAQNFSLGSYTSGWRLPTRQDYDSLQQRGRYVPGQNHDYGKTTQGLDKLGFKGVSLIDGSGGEQVWMTEDASTPTEMQKLVIFKLNHDDKIESIEKNDSKTQKPFLVVRDFPSAADQTPVHARASSRLTDPLTLSLTSLTQNVTISDTLHGTNTTTRVTLPRVQARADFLLASGGNFSVGQPTDSPTAVSLPVTSLRFSDDVTDLVEWSILKNNLGDPDYAEISNAPGQEGVVFWHPDSNGALQSVTVHAAVTGVSAASLAPTALAANLTLTPPANFNKSLKSLAITPRNVLYTTRPAQGQNVFYATGFYSDGSVADLTTQVRWEVLDGTTQTPVDPGQAVFSSNAPGVLILGTVTSPNLIIRASTGSSSDTTPLQVSI